MQLNPINYNHNVSLDQAVITFQKLIKTHSLKCASVKTAEWLINNYPFQTLQILQKEANVINSNPIKNFTAKELVAGMLPDIVEAKLMRNIMCLIETQKLFYAFFLTTKIQTPKTKKETLQLLAEKFRAYGNFKMETIILQSMPKNIAVVPKNTAGVKQKEINILNLTLEFKKALEEKKSLKQASISLSRCFTEMSIEEMKKLRQQISFSDEQVVPHELLTDLTLKKEEFLTYEGLADQLLEANICLREDLLKDS